MHISLNKYDQSRLDNEPEQFYYSTFKINSFISGFYITILATQKGIYRLLLNQSIEKDNFFNIIKLQEDDPFLFNLSEQLKEYFSNKRKKFELPLDLKGTEFQMKVWSKLKEIPYGKVVSYKDIAISLGNKKLVRAVGRANSKNPLPIIIPCHRVINSNGKLGGYSGGLEIKIKLLEIEGSLPLELF
ncbi:MAG: methylated-DNA--[protein]-cysteine S-methyltransferase [Ignavibacterium sp.]